MDRLSLSVDQLESVVGDGEYVKSIREGLEKRSLLKRVEEETKKEIKDLNDELLPILAMHGIGSVSSGLGSISYTEGESVSLNRDRLVNAMLKQGWDAAVIAEVMKEGTTRTPYVTLTFRKPPTPKNRG